MVLIRTGRHCGISQELVIVGSGLFPFTSLETDLPDVNILHVLCSKVDKRLRGKKTQ